MSQQHQAQLQEAYRLIKAGQKQEATRLLLDVLRQNRDSADAWWLLANATSDPKKQQQALNQVLRVKPDHNAAQRMLESANAAATMRPVTPPPVTPPPSASKPADDPFGDPFAAPTTSSWNSSTSDDPFAASSSRTAPPADDPFGDPFAAPKTNSWSSSSDDLFAAPSSRTATPADDPFGDPFAAPGSRSTPADDPFGDPFAAPKTTSWGTSSNDDPFTVGRTYAPDDRARAVPPKKKGTNPLVIVLAIIGIIAVIGCGLFAITAIAGVSLFNTAVQTAMPEGTFQAAMQDLELALTSMPATFAVNENGIIGTIVEKGMISFTQPVNATLEADGFTNHAYKFTGESGQDVTIELTAQTEDFDVKLTLLGPDGDVVAENDDIDFENNNLNSRIATILPANGVYTAVVSDIGFGGGDYELRVTRDE